ncbi:hypothetical protein HELRODRAFT_72925 [Helobdella robusta]|uniref:G-protein coupled receptors family 1 profile domain-containing protein n=1 Tax=Helobdella robusta TaxID=6412 RepID=T1G173_HELRO|nr:hypothetical protein HELRODRAFT_72925 [Helobdella robusta]ESO10141.1 hypothetical protein HELRODRAFT_72925 [Helobdella robusta]
MESETTKSSVIYFYPSTTTTTTTAYNIATTAATTSSSSSTAATTATTSILIAVIKSLLLGSIIICAVVGNALVILSVSRYHNLRTKANMFIVSLAFADLLVALLVMPFSASQEVAGRWLFDGVTCDLFNANDVLFSTASLLNLCCISLDRYIAITDPFNYTTRLNKCRVVVILVSAWLASILVSHLPIHLKIYSADAFGRQQKIINDDDEEVINEICSFQVNWLYGIVSSLISFWIPTIVMLFTYQKIFNEAKRQVEQIENITNLLSAFQAEMKNQAAAALQQQTNNENRRIKREHKAAKTLGIIMGVFLGCWLPFFIWYLTDSICREQCNTPKVFISFLFWVGYANSALNPLIYAFFNREFRGAFRKQLCHCKRALTWSRAKKPHLVTELAASYSERHNWSGEVSYNKKDDI